jgi:hypothetical protein
MADRQFDVVIIGGGPGGYNAAIRAASSASTTVACVDKRGTFGGTCLNIGCIPSKALLQPQRAVRRGAHVLAAKLGIKRRRVELDLPGMMAHKTKVVGELTKGVEFLFKKNKVDEAIKSARRASRPGKVEVEGGDGKARTLAPRTSSSPPAPTCAAARRRGRREAHRESTGALTLETCRSGCGRRRRLYRARAGLGLAPARQRGDGGGIPRPHHAGHGRRDRQAVPAHPGAPGHQIQAVDQGHRRRKRKARRGSRRTGAGGGAGDARSRCRAGRHRPPPLTDGLGLDEAGSKLDERGKRHRGR